MYDPTRESRQRRPLFALIADIPALVGDLVKAELQQLKYELVRKLVNAGIGIGLVLAAGLVAFFAIAVLIAVAILGLAEVLPAWLAALIVGVGLVLVTVALALLGVSRLKRGMPPVPTATIRSVKKDLDAIKGGGKRGM